MIVMMTMIVMVMIMMAMIMGMNVMNDDITILPLDLLKI